MSLLLAAALLVLSVLFVRPVAKAAWRIRLLLHSLVLAGCLQVHAFASPPLLPVAGEAVVLLQAGLLAKVSWRSVASGVSGSVVWTVAGLLTAWFAAWLLHDPGVTEDGHGLLVVSLGVLLTGLVGATVSRERRVRIGSLLLAGNGVMLAACTLPGPGWTGVACVALLQGWMLAGLSAGERPVAQ